MKSHFPNLFGRVAQKIVPVAVLVFALLLCAPAAANNLTIENVTLTGFNATSHYALIQFDIRWENSWRLDVAPGNYDAVWLFVKFRAADGVWRHATLNATGHSVDDCNVSTTMEMTDDENGMFLYRTSMGAGDVVCTGAHLRWNYGEDAFMDNEGNVDVGVYGIEMVYIPEGSFYLGSGGMEAGHFYMYPDPASPYLVSSEAAIDVGATPGNLYYDSFGDQIGPVPAEYPKGYAPFYMMKYEVTQQQWVDFLNTLLADEIYPRFHPSMYLVSDGGTPPTFSAPFPDRPMQRLRFDIALAYAAWAALRMPTEMEWEKAARGTAAPVPDEYAWGSTDITDAFYTLANEGTPDEIVTNPASLTGNAAFAHPPNYANPSIPGQRPGRVGIFAASFPNASHPNPPSRAESGASYYGVMEMSGNVDEAVVSIANEGGRTYAGHHGDGVVPPNISVQYQPVYNAVGARGGTYGSQAGGLRLSGRVKANHSYLLDGQGFRAARTAP